MDSPDAAIEAEVDLDGKQLARGQQRRKSRRGKQAAPVAKGDLTVGELEDANEQSRLVSQDQPDSDDAGQDDTDAPWSGSDFAHLPWHKRPSILWVIFPFFILAVSFGGYITPKLNLILELVCREYMSERMMNEPGFTALPVNFNNGDNNQCRIPEVQSRVSMLTLWGSLISGGLSALSSGKLGALSDRYGRKPILITTSIGTILGEVIFIAAARFPDTFPVSLLLLSFALDGITGSFLLAMSISNAYATDCTPPARRNVAFGYFHGCLFTGLALGPIVAGYIVKWTGQIIVVFYILTSVHIAFVFFVSFVIPESLSHKRQQTARDKHELLTAMKGPEWDWINQVRALNILEPLKILHPTGPGTSPALRRNLFVLAAVDTIAFGVAMGSLTITVIYVNIQFGWATFESGRFMTIVNSCRVFGLIVLLPAATRLARGRRVTSKQKNTGCDWFDLAVIRIAVLFDTLGYLGYSLSRTGGMFTLSGVVAAIGGIGSPTLQSALTKHVPADRTGQLLGAMGLLHSLARVIAPAVFNAIYSATVGSFRQTVFLCLCATFGLAFVVSWLIRPGVYYDEDLAAQHAEDQPDETPDDELEEGNRLPIVSAITSAVYAFGAMLGIGSSNAP